MDTVLNTEFTRSAQTFTVLLRIDPVAERDLTHQA